MKSPIPLSVPPWLTGPLQGTLQQKLSQEMSMLANYLTPTDFESRKKIFAHLRGKLQSLGYSLKIFGSCSTGLYLSHSDLDLVIMVEYENPTANQMKRILKKVYGMFNGYPQFEYISRAKIPLLKFKVNSIPVDLSVNSASNSVDYSIRCKSILRECPMVGKLCLVLKQFLRCRGLESNSSGGVGGFFLFLWLATFLQHRYPKKYSNISKTDTSQCEVAEIEQPFTNIIEGGGQELFEFMHFFGSEFNYSQQMCCPYTLNVLQDRDYERFKKGIRLVIVDPINCDNALELCADRVLVITEHFRNCCRLLVNNGGKSLLGRILNVDTPKDATNIKTTNRGKYRDHRRSGCSEKLKPQDFKRTTSKLGKKVKISKDIVLETSSRGKAATYIDGFEGSFGTWKKKSIKSARKKRYFGAKRGNF